MPVKELEKEGICMIGGKLERREDGDIEIVNVLGRRCPLWMRLAVPVEITILLNRILAGKNGIWQRRQRLAQEKGSGGKIRTV